MMIIETPIGALHALFDDEARLCELRFDTQFLGFLGVPRSSSEGVESPRSSEEPRNSEGLRLQLLEYFAGRRKAFDVPLAPKGTPFQLAVWNALLEVPYGETVTYAELARRIGRPAAVRAVGAANGANPIPVIIPCHRVIGSNGTLTGYGGGIERKQWLLALEGRRLF